VREVPNGVDQRVLAVLVDERDLALARVDEQHRHPPRDLDPLTEPLGVTDRRAQDDELRARIEADDRLLPHVPALGIVEVVALVHHDDVCRRDMLVGDDAVPQNLGDLDLDRCLAIDLVVAGREADVRLTEVLGQLAKLLFGERAQRRRVDRLLALPHRAMQRRLGHDRLAGSGGHGDEQALARVDVADRLLLDGIRLESLRQEKLVVERHLQIGVGGHAK
jgi:hypothetical protein